MAITVIYSDKQKNGWTFDYKKKQWKGFLLDILKFDGSGKPLKRLRLQYARRADAENSEREIETEKQNARLGLFKTKQSKDILLWELLDRHRATYTQYHRQLLALRVYTLFLSLLPENIKVTDLKTADFQKYVERRSAEVNAKTVNHELGVITPALKSGYLYYGELDGWQMPFVPRIAGANRRRERLVTDAEKQILLDHLRRMREPDELHKNFYHRIRLADWIEFKALTGFRRKEIAALKKTSYDRRGRALINVWRYKTNKPTAYFPLTKRAAEIIEERLTLEPDSEFIFTPDGKPINSNYRSLKKICEHLKIPYGRNVIGGFVMHDLKRNFATAIQQVADIATIRELTSNSSDSLNVYLNTSHKQMRDAMKKMEGLDSSEELKRIFDAVQNKEMDFEEFVSQIKK